MTQTDKRKIAKDDKDWKAEAKRNKKVAPLTVFTREELQRLD